MSATRLRRGAEVDLPRVTALVAAAYGHYIDRLGRVPLPMRTDHTQPLRDGRVTLAERDGELSGLIVTAHTPEGFCVENVAVHPRHWGTGCGRTLLRHAESAARDGGYDSVYLYTHELMTENLALYQRIGYVEYRREDRGGFFAVYLRKPLS